MIIPMTQLSRFSLLNMPVSISIQIPRSDPRCIASVRGFRQHKLLVRGVLSATSHAETKPSPMGSFGIVSDVPVTGPKKEFAIGVWLPSSSVGMMSVQLILWTGKEKWAVFGPPFSFSRAVEFGTIPGNVRHDPWQRADVLGIP
jgi:hypothetical protein